MRRLFMIGASSLFVSCTTAEQRTQPVETGKVSWERNLDVALKTSKKCGKPVFLLFQEVPGCAGCKQFGREVLSNPLIVSAIEREFVPLLIHNNKGGHDAEVLKKFSEPAWNYQVVRFIDGDGKDLIPRKEKVWDVGPLAERMIESLEKAGRQVPGYLETVRYEGHTKLQKVAFSMFCFWTGEAKLGAIEGVITTEAGWIGSKEVVLIEYDPAAIPLTKLIKEAAALDCASAVYLPPDSVSTLDAGRLPEHHLIGYRKAKASDQKRQLQGTKAAKLKLTPVQATKVNAWIRTKPEKAQTYLAPDQRWSL